MFRDQSMASPLSHFRTLLKRIAVAIVLSCFLGGHPTLAQESSPPRPSDYERQFRSFTKNSRVDDLAIQRVAAYNLCQLHAFIVSDPRFATHEKLKSLRVTIAKRLRDWEKDYQVTLKRLERRSQKLDRTPRQEQSPATEKFSADAIDPFSPSAEPSEGKEDYSPQEIAEFQNGTHQNGTDERAAESDIDWADDDIQLIPVFGHVEDDLDRELISCLGDSSELLGDLSGGAGQVYRYAGANFGAPWNHSADLMALIRQVVSPDVWRTAGGNSSMFYFQPAGALVIRASQKTHDDVCDLLWKLRAAF